MKNIFFIVFFIIVNCGDVGNIYAQTITWYYPWENAIQKLEAARATETIPLPLKGKDFRILKITNNSSKLVTLTGYSAVSQGVSIEVYSLPVIRNFNNRPILDLMQPFQGGMISINKGAAAYFLVKYKGLRKGQDNVSVTFKQSNGKSLTTSKKVYVGNALEAPKLNMNVWANFSYPLIKGLQNQVVNDLVAHHANVLIIPSNVLPSVTAGKIANSTPKLDNFLKGLAGKFDYYIVYHNYKDFDKDFALSDKWKRNFPQWHQLVKQSLIKAGVDYSKVYFYLFDEPNVKQAEDLINMIKWNKESHIDARFYVTISGPATMGLAKYADIVQIYNKAQNFTAYDQLQGNKAKLWFYDIISEARNRSALTFLKYGWMAYKYKADGIGAWNYADIKKAYTDKELQTMNAGSSNPSLGSWTFSPQNYQKDYSLIYREGNHLYSSLRWEALSQSIQEYQFLSIYQSKYGKQKTNTLISQLLSGKMTLEEWNMTKLSLID